MKWTTNAVTIQRNVTLLPRTGYINISETDLYWYLILCRATTSYFMKPMHCLLVKGPQSVIFALNTRSIQNQWWINVIYCPSLGTHWPRSVLHIGVLLNWRFQMLYKGECPDIGNTLILTCTVVHLCEIIKSIKPSDFPLLVPLAYTICVDN